MRRRLDMNRVAHVALLALAAIAASSSGAAATLSDSGARFILRAPQQTIGREMYQTSTGPGPGERTVEAEAWAVFPRGGRYHLRQRLTFDVLGRLRGYEGAIDSPSGPIGASASVLAGKCSMSLVLADSTRSRTVDVPADAVLLDPFFANHYQWLLDRLFAAGTTAPLPDSLYVVTPQSLEARRAGLVEIQAEVGFFEGRAVTARRVELDLPKQRAQIWFDEKNGRLYRVRLVTQLMDIVREGFRPSSGDTALPARGLDPLRLPALDESGLCSGASLIRPAGEARAVALLLPDGGPPEAPADSSSAVMDRLARSLAEAGIAAITINPPASRCTGTNAIVRGWVNPAVEIIHSLQAGGVPPERVFIIGHGLGAVAAARLAVRDSLVLGGLVLLAPPAGPAGEWLRERASRCSGKRPASDDLGWAPGEWTDLEAFDLSTALSRSDLPVLVLSAQEDCETDARRAQSVFARALRSSSRAESESVLLPDLDHHLREVTRSSSTNELPRFLEQDLKFWIYAVLPLQR
jgi:pimeloyl-ACP methyl ester carboxylesterase